MLNLTRKLFLTNILLTLLLAQPLLAQKPNFIIILTDDQGYNDLSCFGSKKIKTPNIDKLAKNGIKFTSFYAQAVCGPSRAALLTGSYPIRIAEPNNLKNQHTILHPKEVTIAEILKSVGYKTACIGKWHLGQRSKTGWNSTTMPNAQGFDYFFGTPLFNGYTVHVKDTRFRSQLLENTTVVKQAIQSWDNITSLYTQKAIQFISQNKSTPFFLYLAHNMPHIPLGASPKFKGKSAYGPYGDTIEEIDHSTGRIVNQLKKLNLLQNTLIIFTSDNGPWIETTRGNRPNINPFIPANHSGNADPLKGYKMLTFDGGLRVPCVMHWPEKIRPNQSSNKVAATIDLLPTLAHLADASLPKNLKLDGKNILPLITNQPNATSHHDKTGFLYYRYTTLEAVRSGKWKLTLPRANHPPQTGWSGRFHNSAVKTLTLNNLDTDPAEKINLADKHPDIVKRLLALIKDAGQNLGDHNQIGKNARFFDPGPKRPGRTKPKPKPISPITYENFKPLGPLHFTFEKSNHNFKVTSGKFPQFITERKDLPNHKQLPFNKQAKRFIFTANDPTRTTGNDTFTGKIQSPPFTLLGDKIAFLIGGGAGPDTYIALIDQDNKILKKAHGSNSPILKRIIWNIPQHKNKTLRILIVDNAKSNWGHITLDDLSANAKILKQEK